MPRKPAPQRAFLVTSAKYATAGTITVALYLLWLHHLAGGS